jgi:hypothetical protein
MSTLETTSFAMLWGRWACAAGVIAQDLLFERQAVARLAQPGSLGSAKVARGLLAELLERMRSAGAANTALSPELVQRIVERCAEQGGLSRCKPTLLSSVWWDHTVITCGLAAGHWDVLWDLAQQQQLACFRHCPGLLPRLAAAHHFRLLASAACQVLAQCLKCSYNITLI